jgi:hypothetical protein
MTEEVMTGTPGALLVQVFLSSAVVRGLASVADGRRLTDVLNGVDEFLELETASFSFGSRETDLASVALEKAEIVAAIPWETRDQDRQRRITSFGGRTRTMQVPALLYVPPYLIEGSIHLSGDPSLTRTLNASPTLFPRFFPVTDARIVREDGKLVRSQIVVVNRDRVASIGRLPADSAPS